jgi:hypothetical protein
MQLITLETRRGCRQQPPGQFRKERSEGRIAIHDYTTEETMRAKQTDANKQFGISEEIVVMIGS